MNPLLVMEVMESPEPTARMGDRNSPQDDSRQQHKAKATCKPASEDPEFYNDEAPHQLDERA